MSARSNPFTELERIMERMSRQFSDATRDWDADGAMDWWTGRLEPMALDLAERDGEFVATVDLPGFDNDDVDVSVTDHTLRIDAEFDRDVEEETGEFVRRERRRESAHRSIRLPKEVDADRVEARMRNGVLTITLPKREPSEAHHIDVK